MIMKTDTTRNFIQKKIKIDKTLLDQYKIFYDFFFINFKKKRMPTRTELMELAAKNGIKNIKSKNKDVLTDELENLGVDLSSFKKTRKRSPTKAKVSKKDALLTYADENKVKIARNKKIEEICEALRAKNLSHEYCDKNDKAPVKRTAKTNKNDSTRLSPNQLINESISKSNVIASPKSSRRNSKASVSDDWSDDWSNDSSEEVQSPKKRGRPASKSPSRSPKKRGRPASKSPKKVETPSSPKKRGRPASKSPKKVETPSSPKKRGRPASKSPKKAATSASPKKRGRPAVASPKKVGRPASASPKKRGRPAKSPKK